MSRDARTIADLLGDALRALGVEQVFIAGSDRPALGLPAVGVPSWELAVLLADAAGRTSAAPGAAWTAEAEQLLHLGSAPGLDPDVVTVDAVDTLLSVVAGWSLGSVLASVVIRIEIDLTAPAPHDAQPFELHDRGAGAFTLAPDLADLSIVVLAGPGVVRAGRVDDLRRAAAALGVGVVNTWGAKGVFRWDDPHHHGTAGLQARDFELAGVSDAQLVLATGIDPIEAPPERWARHQVLEVDPAALGALALRWPAPGEVPPRPPLYERLSSALADRYTNEAVPLAAARACSDLAAVRPAGALVAADPGPAGFWVARAYPTDEPGSVVVPSSSAPGFAAAAAFVSGLRERAALAVVAERVDDRTGALLELAARDRVPMAVAVWGSEGEIASPADHRAAIVGALRSPGVDVVEVPVDLDDLDRLTSIAGDVVAWAHPEL